MVASLREVLVNATSSEFTASSDFIGNSTSSSVPASESASESAASSAASSSEFSWDTYYTPETSDYATAMFTLACVAVVVLPLLLYIHRKHPLVQARYPYICATEVIEVLLVLMFTASQQSNPLWKGWGLAPCWLYNAVETAISAVLWNITATRLVLFYRVAQLNTWDYGGKTSWMENFIHWFGIINAPYEFKRTERRLAILVAERSGGTTLGVSSISGGLVSSESNASIGADYTFIKRKSEPFVWFAKLFGWFLFWAILTIIITYGSSAWNYTEPLAFVDESCYGVSTYLIEAQLIFWNILQCGIVFSWLRKPADSLGLKTELMFMQSLYLVMWVTDAAQILAYADLYNTQGMYLDLICMLIHALVTALYPIILLYYRQFQNTRLQGSYKGATTIDAEQLWKEDAGRQIIINIVAKNLAVENTLFLSATDNPDKIQTRKKVKEVYDRFISDSAPFEINIPYKLRPEWEKLFASQELPENYMDIINSTRSVVFSMLTTNYSHMFLQSLGSGDKARNNV